MKRQRSRWRASLVLGLAFTLVAAACGGDDDEEAGGGGGGGEEADIICEETGGGGADAAATTTTAADAAAADPAAPAEQPITPDPAWQGTTVSVFGPEVEVEQESLQQAFAEFEDATGITVDVSGDRGFEEQIGSLVDGDNPPDIAIFPQPGKVNDFADDIVNLPPDVMATVQSNFDEAWTELVTIDGQLKAIPNKADLKSLVWYCPSVFEENGYEVPTTQDEFTALAERMVEDGNTPFCVGLGSDAATGWPLTDWIEDYMLRLKGPDVYDQWYRHEIPFDHPDVVEVGQAVVDMLSTDGYVFGGFENIASTPFSEAGLPMLEGDCMMHRISNFYAALWPDSMTVGPGLQIDAFFLPGSDEHPNITLSGGTYAAAFADRPEVMATMNFIASTGFGNGRAATGIGGFLSPNRNVDTSLYPTELEQSFGQILANADPIRFDASDLMPGEVGSGTFWTAAVDITTGTPVDEAFAEVEESWPR